MEKSNIVFTVRRVSVIFVIVNGENNLYIQATIVHDVSKYGVGNAKLYHGTSVILLVLFVLQYVTGAVLSVLYVFGLDVS